MENPTRAWTLLLFGMVCAFGCQSPSNDADTEGDAPFGAAGAPVQSPALDLGGASGLPTGNGGATLDLGNPGSVSGATGSVPSGGGSGATNSGASDAPGSGAGASGGSSAGRGGADGSAGAKNSGGVAGASTSSGGQPAGAGGAAGGVPAHGACLDGIKSFDSDGPFKVTTRNASGINFYVPGVPAGCKVPVVHLANGTGASCATYAAALQRLATHGFLAACYESANTGAGDQGLKALDTALSTFPALADNKFGSTGHSQGGQAAFTVLALAEKKYGDKFIYAGLAIEPASGFGSQPSGATWQALYGAIKSPMFMFSGLGTDGLVSQSWVQQAYDATSKTEEAYFWTKKGANHIPVPNGEVKQISIPWFRWKLLGDQAACRAFKAIPKTDTTWAQVAVKNETPCQ